MAKNRKSIASSLDEVDRTMYSTFSSAANSLSQLYSQALSHQKLSFLSGERTALIIDAIRRILYAVEEDPSIVEEAQAMLLNQEKQLNPISEDVEEYKIQKRKSFINLDVDVAASATLSPRQRVSDASDVHCSGSPLMTY